MGAVTSSSSSSSSPKAVHAPKQDRSRATRQRLLEAAVACLAEHGWAGSTVSVVAERAGVSRGAAQHHFPTR
ncbi:TetR family transcriptional regulator, partial [Streptomyces bacillaris]